MEDISRKAWGVDPAGKIPLQYVKQASVIDKRDVVGFLCYPGLQGFVEVCLPFFPSRVWYFGKHISEMDKIIAKSDIMFFEWGNELLEYILARSIYPPINVKKTICRLHSYEVTTSTLGNINWEKVDDIIFVAEQVRDEFVRRCCPPRTLAQLPFKTHVIPNGIDMNKFTNEGHHDVKKIGYLGYLNFKKAPTMIFHAFMQLLKKDPDLQLHIAGIVQETRFLLWMREFIQTYKMEDRIIMRGYVSAPEFLNEMGSIISASPWEGHLTAGIEALASGCKLLLHNYVGAKAQFGPYAWGTFDELDELWDTEWTPEVYRQYVLDHGWTLDDMGKRMREVVYG